MNFIEAIQSGKRWRRRGTEKWYSPGRIDLSFAGTHDDFIAEDWEVEQDHRQYSVSECIHTLSLLRDTSHDMVPSMIDSIIYHLKTDKR